MPRKAPVSTEFIDTEADDESSDGDSDGASSSDNSGTRETHPVRLKSFRTRQNVRLEKSTQAIISSRLSRWLSYRLMAASLRLSLILRFPYESN